MQTKTLLIHGFASNYEGCDPYRKFYGFQSQVDFGTAELFRWGIFCNLNALNILGALHLYRAEQKLSRSSESQKNLIFQILESKSKTLVCHSMGSQLLLNAINTFGTSFLENVQRIIIVQGDCDWSDSTLTTIPGSIQIYSTFCPWDLALWQSWILNLRVPAGLFGIRFWNYGGEKTKNKPKIINKFWGFWRRNKTFNFHTMAIGESGFGDWVAGLSG
jgi:hypothetical protein